MDSSITQLTLNHGFRIETIPEEEAIDFIHVIDDLPSMEVGKVLFMQYPCLNPAERQCYSVSHFLEVDVKNKGSLFTTMAKFDNGLVHGYLDPIFRLARLFKEGDIRMPIKYYYKMEKGKPSRRMKAASGKHISHEPYHLDSSETRDLKSFLQDVELPFKRDFVELAFESFELSYEIPSIALSFLTLMISLETLFNPGEHELRYRISRNSSILLSEDEKDFKRIFSEIKDLYDKRSAIVHTGKLGTIEKADLLNLRCYVRKSIKKMCLMKASKNSILERFNLMGFQAIK